MSFTRSRHLETEQLLDRQHEAQAVRLRGQVIHALDERNDLLPLLLLGGLLDARMQIADRRHARSDRLAIELEHEPQHAVRAGVLRPHVDGHRFACASSAIDSIDLAATTRYLRDSLASMFALNSSSLTSSGSYVCAAFRIWTG